METKGKVQYISAKERNTRYGVKTAYGIRIDNVWYNHGFKAPQVKEGDYVKIEYTEGSFGKDIKNIEKVSGEAPANQQSNGSANNSGNGGFRRGSTFPIPEDDYQNSIIRQNCVGNAREIALAKMPKSSSVEDVLETTLKIAKILEAYCTGRMDIDELVQPEDNEEDSADE